MELLGWWSHAFNVALEQSEQSVVHRIQDTKMECIEDEDKAIMILVAWFLTVL